MNEKKYIVDIRLLAASAKGVMLICAFSFRLCLGLEKFGKKKNGKKLGGKLLDTSDKIFLIKL